MMNSTEELQIDAGKPRGGMIQTFRSAAARSLDAIAAFLETHSWLGLLAILALYLFYLKTHATLRPPWHDELFTYYISQAPTFGQMLRETQTLDLNPPLSYVLTRFVFSVLHPSTFSLRLPSMISFGAAAYCLYLFVARRLSRIYGFLGAFLLLGSFYKSYAFEARPYALVLAFLGIAAVGWQRAIDQDHRRSRRLGLLLLVLGGFGMLLSHVLALVAYGGFFFAEFARFLKRRKPDWLLWICLALPLSSGILYLPLFKTHGSGAFPSAFQSSLVRVTGSYSEVWSELGALLATAMIAIFLLGWQNTSVRPSAAPAAPRNAGFSIVEGTFAVYLLFVPLIIALEFMRSHAAYFDRYGMAAIFGAGILVPWLIAAWTGLSRGAGLLAALVFTFGLVPPSASLLYLEKHANLLPADSPDLTGVSPVPLSRIEPNLPIVDASGLTFLEMDNRESSSFLNRVYYLTDPQAALQYSHATIFEGFTGLKHIFPIRANVMPYQQFIQQHPKFLVYGGFDYPEDWVLRKLMADGATARYVGAFSQGYKDSTLYEVTLPQQ